MTSVRIDPIEIENIIDRHNKDLPKDPNANIDELILIDNSISKALEYHLGTLTVVIGYGSYGTGKTWTSYKIFHSLKNKAYITYVPIRMYRKAVGSQSKCVKNNEGEVSLVATIIAEALVRPETLKGRVGDRDVLTNAPDIQDIVICDRTIKDVIEDYHERLIKGKGFYPYHVVLLDEFDEGVETVADIDAIVDVAQVLRNMIDKYGRSRVTVVALMAPVPSQRLGRVWADEPIYNIIIKRLQSRATTTLGGPYEAVALLNLNLGTRENVRTMLIEFVKKSVEIINNKYRINISVSGIEKAADVLVRIWPTMRWCRDVMVKGLARAIAETLNRGVKEVDISNYIYDVIKDLLVLDNTSYVTKVFEDGKWGSIFGDMEINIAEPDNRFRRFCEEILRAACPDCEINMYNYREERGFTSLFYRIYQIKKVVEKEKKHEKETEKKREVEIKPAGDVTFWLRLSNITNKSISKAKKIFGKTYVVLIIPNNVKIQSSAENIIITITLTPIEMYYLLTATSKAIDAKLREYLEGVLNERIREYAPRLGKILGVTYV
jgi:hypothetical protein